MASRSPSGVMASRPPSGRKLMVQKQGIQQMKERTLGERGTDQDVSIILVPNGGSRDEKLALIHLHSNVLSTHSKYFNACLSERWTKPASPSASIEFVLEVQTDVEFYFDCFCSMYSPSVKTFQGVKYGVELLKVASQIVFQELMEHISLYLSTMVWSKEDEIRVREYSSSPGFPRIHLEDLVARLGLDESEEHCQKQLCNMIQECIRTALNLPLGKFTGPRDFFIELFRGMESGAPSNHARTVAIAIVVREAKDMFVNIGKDWKEKTISSGTVNEGTRSVRAMCWILEALLKVQGAEELVHGFVHLDAIPTYMCKACDDYWWLQEKKKLAKLVLVLYQEVAVGRLLLRSPERMALLANWHSIMKSTLEEGSFEDATRKLFSTLPLKQQMELINLRKETFDDYISTSSLISMLSKRRWSGRELDFNVCESETVDPVVLDSKREV